MSLKKLKFKLQTLILAQYSLQPIPMAVRSKAWVCGRLLAGIVGLKPAGGMDIFLLWVLYVAR